ncbi:MAG TPA: hypothetical protein V6D29_13600 [Leptolyngbyaceae cyanobacterium]
MKRPLWLILATLMIAGASSVPVIRGQGCLLRAWAAELRDFGTDGSDGRSGRSGQDGRPGSDQTVTANGTPLNLNLAGEDGGNGESGESGDRPQCGSQPRDVAYDLQAADGGDGGDGGRGGNGGNGGSLTVYYADPAALRQVAVDARGGRSGRGGAGGQGRGGCQCDRTEWTLQTCTGTPGTPGYSCRDDRYVCRDGRYGSNGAYGSDGQDGQPGQLRLVNQLEPLPPETPTLTLPLENLLNQPVALSKNLWDVRTGAAALLAPGSQVADSYLAYRGRVEGNAQIVWNAPRPVAAFAGTSITTAISETGDLGLAFPNDVWIVGEPSRTETLTTFTVTGAVRASDATRLAWGTSQGRGRDLTMNVVDLGRESAFLTTRFRLMLRTTSDDPGSDRNPRYTVRYDDWIPDELITRDGDRFILAIGRLPISQGVFRSGTLARVELKAVRSLGPNSAEQTLSWDGNF